MFGPPVTYSKIGMKVGEFKHSPFIPVSFNYYEYNRNIRKTYEVVEK
jgi:hypothetical protein